MADLLRTILSVIQMVFHRFRIHCAINAVTPTLTTKEPAPPPLVPEVLSLVDEDEDKGKNNCCNTNNGCWLVPCELPLVLLPLLVLPALALPRGAVEAPPPTLLSRMLLDIEEYETTAVTAATPTAATKRGVRADAEEDTISR